MERVRTRRTRRRCRRTASGCALPGSRCTTWSRPPSATSCVHARPRRSGRRRRQAASRSTRRPWGVLMERVREFGARGDRSIAVRRGIARLEERDARWTKDRADVAQIMEMADATLGAHEELEGAPDPARAGAWFEEADRVMKLERTLPEVMTDRERAAHLAAAGRKPEALDEAMDGIRSRVAREEAERERMRLVDDVLVLSCAVSERVDAASPVHRDTLPGDIRAVLESSARARDVPDPEVREVAAGIARSRAETDLRVVAAREVGEGEIFVARARYKGDPDHSAPGGQGGVRRRRREADAAPGRRGLAAHGQGNPRRAGRRRDARNGTSRTGAGDGGCAEARDHRDGGRNPERADGARRRAAAGRAGGRGSHRQVAPREAAAAARLRELHGRRDPGDVRRRGARSWSACPAARGKRSGKRCWGCIAGRCPETRHRGAGGRRRSRGSSAWFATAVPSSTAGCTPRSSRGECRPDVRPPALPLSDCGILPPGSRRNSPGRRILPMQRPNVARGSCRFHSRRPPSAEGCRRGSPA